MEAPPDTPLPLDAWLSALPAVTVHEVTLSMSPVRAARFDEPLNVVVRGLLGDAFRTRRCLTGAPRCDGCGEAPACDFERVFERDEGGGQRPFWLRGLHARPTLRLDERLRVTVAVLDRERAMLPDFTAALRHALGRLGAGGGEAQTVGVPSRAAGALLRNAATETGIGAVRFETRTPVLLRGDDDAGETLCPDAPGFGKLLRAGVRRLASIARGVDPTHRVGRVVWPDLRGLQRFDDRVGPWRAGRFSRAQGRRQPIEGVEGAVVIEGAGITEVLPLLRAIERVGVGRKTSFGFGEIHVEALR